MASRARGTEGSNGGARRSRKSAVHCTPAHVDPDVSVSVGTCLFPGGSGAVSVFELGEVRCGVEVLRFVDCFDVLFGRLFLIGVLCAVQLLIWYFWLDGRKWLVLLFVADLLCDCKVRLYYIKIL